MDAAHSASIRRLILNADDLGMCPSANRGIALAWQAGRLTSASLMTTTGGFLDAVEIAHRLEMTVGLHFVLTSGRCAAAPEKVNLLVDQQGRFQHGFLGLARLLYGRRREQALAQMTEELRCQWARLARAGIAATHLDSHQHVHMLPGLFDLTSRFAAAHDLRLRISYEPVTRGGPSPVPRSSWWSNPVGRLRRMLLARLSERVNPTAQSLRRSDQCYGIVHSGRMTGDVLRSLIASLPPGCSELLTHPAAAADNAPDEVLSSADRHFSASPWRQRELAALLSADLPKTLAQHGVQLIDARRAAHSHAA